jgi:hypothetical protein
MALRLAPGIAWQTIDGEGVVIDVEHGRSLGLNRAGALILALLEGHDEEVIARELCRQFRVGQDEARADVAGFLTALREAGLVVDA